MTKKIRVTLQRNRDTFYISIKPPEEKRLNLYPGTTDQRELSKIMDTIERDWNTGDFDWSLESYKFVSIKRRRAKEKHLGINQSKSMTTLWNEWTEAMGLNSDTPQGYYKVIQSNLEKAGNPNHDDVRWFVSLDNSAVTWNRKKSYLIKCLEYHGLKDTPYHHLKARIPAKKDKIEIFTENEVKTILAALKTNSHCSESSVYRHSDYYPYVLFLFATGVRLGEASGLTWNKVDLSSKTITISQTLARKKDSPRYTKNKELKDSTKTGTVRHIPLTDKVMDLIFSQLDTTKAGSQEFVFTLPDGKFIDQDKFRDNIWKPLLRKLGLKIRYPYQIRHTVLSHVARDYGLAEAAHLAGHVNLSTVTKHYVRMINDEVNLPNLI